MKEWVTFFEVVQSGIMVYPLYILLKHKIKCPMAVFYTIIACLFILLKNRLLGLDRYNLLYDLLRGIYDFLNTLFIVFLIIMHYKETNGNNNSNSNKK